MWVSIRSLCELGVEIDIEKHFDTLIKNASPPSGGSAKGANRPGVSGGGGGGGCGHPSSRTADGARGGFGGRRLPPWAPYALFNSGGGGDGGGLGGGGGVQPDRCAGFGSRDNGE